MAASEEGEGALRGCEGAATHGDAAVTLCCVSAVGAAAPARRLGGGRLGRGSGYGGWGGRLLASAAGAAARRWPSWAAGGGRAAGELVGAGGAERQETTVVRSEEGAAEGAGAAATASQARDSGRGCLCVVAPLSGGRRLEAAMGACCVAAARFGGLVVLQREASRLGGAVQTHAPKRCPAGPAPSRHSGNHQQRHCAFCRLPAPACRRPHFGSFMPQLRLSAHHGGVCCRPPPSPRKRPRPAPPHHKPPNCGARRATPPRPRSQSCGGASIR